MTTYLNATRQVKGSHLNESVAAQVANAVDTYLTGSIIAPANALAARTHFCWRGVMTKTAAGVVAPTFRIRLGVAGTIADAIRVALVSPSAQTAIADTGCFEIKAILRANGAAAILDATLKIGHDLLATGFADRPTPMVHVTGAAFNLDAIVNPYLGLSVDPGAAGVWTFEQVIAEMDET